MVLLRSRNGNNGFSWACIEGHTNVVKLLLDNSDGKVDLNARALQGQTGFMNACSYGHIDVVKLCLDYSEVLDVNVPEINQLSEAIMDLLKFKNIE